MSEMAMSEMIICLFLIILASMYFGVIIGRQGNNKQVQKAVDKTLRESKEKEEQLAEELGVELTKIREGLVSSAQAYQQAVQAVGDRLGMVPGLDLGNTTALISQDSGVDSSGQPSPSEETTEGQDEDLGESDKVSPIRSVG